MVRSIVNKKVFFQLNVTTLLPKVEIILFYLSDIFPSKLGHSRMENILVWPKDDGAEVISLKCLWKYGFVSTYRV